MEEDEEGPRRRSKSKWLSRRTQTATNFWPFGRSLVGQLVLHKELLLGKRGPLQSVKTLHLLVRELEVEDICVHGLVRL